MSEGTWADVDAWVDHHLITVNKRLDEESARLHVHRHRDRAARRNVEHWFRDLPPDLVHALVDEVTGVVSAPTSYAPPDAVWVANDWLLERGFGLKTPRTTRPPTPPELALIQALKSCRFPPATAAKRFARELSEAAVTELQVGWARELVKKFRRQIPPEALHECDRHLLNKPKAVRRGR